MIHCTSLLTEVNHAMCQACDVWQRQVLPSHITLFILRGAGVAAPKRRRIDDAAEVLEMPKWLQVSTEDDEKTRQKKRKLVKAYKSKARFAKLDLQQKQKADAWKRFLTGKPKKSKQ